MTDIKGIVVLRFDEDGEQSYHVFGDAGVRLFIVDERVPHDRVYEVLSRDDPATFRDLIPEGAEVGSSQDDRHAAVSHRVDALRSGRKFLSVVEPEA